MIQENLVIKCDEVLSLEPKALLNHAPYVQLLLDDVDIDSLLVQLAEKLDIEIILDYFTDDDIKAYLEKGNE